ncbi:MAG TPA: hypothetical protein VIQ55_01745 [Burkholderiales bacterium]|jgi:uncharacterized membrane protein
MSAYHVMLVHFPIALWTTAFLLILARSLSGAPLVRAAEGALTPLLALGALSGWAAFAAGLLVWPMEAVASSPLARNHLLLAAWSLAYWTLLWLVRWRAGERVWEGMSRWIMLVLAALGVGLQTLTGTIGGYLAGNPSAVSEIVRRLGWEVFTTFYLPTWMLAVVVAAALILAALGFAGRRATARRA